jgi:hypothetical protein
MAPNLEVTNDFMAEANIWTGCWCLGVCWRGVAGDNSREWLGVGNRLESKPSSGRNENRVVVPPGPSR